MSRHPLQFRTIVPRLVLLVVVCLCLPHVVLAQNGACDPGLPVPKNDALRYQQRGDARNRSDRCEGVYVREVGATTLLVASFTAAFPAYDLKSNSPLTVTWPRAGDEVVRLRAYSLRHKAYFRMDTERPAGSTSFAWPVSVLAGLNLNRADLGVVGWTRLRVGGIDHDVYLPLGIHQDAPEVRPSDYELAIVPDRELSEVFVSLAKVGADGVLSEHLQENVPLERGYYPADRRIVIPVRGLRDFGLYYLEIGARFRGVGSGTVGIWFRHAQPPVEQ